MRKNNCEVIRRELDELMLDETCSTAALEHLRECGACRKFHEKQTKLRQIVGSLGTVAAPADFDFRLRARLANESASAASHFSFVAWPVQSSSYEIRTGRENDQQCRRCQTTPQNGPSQEVKVRSHAT